MRNTTGIVKLISLAWLSVIGLSACGGGADTEGNPDTGKVTNEAVMILLGFRL